MKKMNIMFMPVGTVCEIQNINGKIMIVGYKENKYVGVRLPKGLSNENPQIIFEKKDIISIIKLGYYDESVETLKNIIINSNKKRINGKYKFDENGVVVSDEVNNQGGQSKGFVFDESGFVVADNRSSEKESKYKFDENGVVVSDGVNNQGGQSKGFVFDESGFVVADNRSSEKESKYKFDENGVVIG